MYHITRILTYSVVRQVCHRLVINYRRELNPICLKLLDSNTAMAQRSITSFFKVSPPKPAVILDKDGGTTENNVPDPSVTSGATKTSKRVRQESSGSEDGSPVQSSQSSPNGSDKKKKPKRQRIESSGSEAESTSFLQESTIKVKKTEKSKTYASPKSNKKLAAKKADKEDKSPPKKKKNIPKKDENEGNHLNIVPKIKEEISEDKNLLSKKENEAAKVNGASPKVLTIKQEKEDSGDVEMVPEAEYAPSAPRYHPVASACWARGAQVPYLALARTLGAVEATAARLKMVEILSNYLRSVMLLTPDDLLPSVYLCLNRLAPAHHSLELGIAETYLMKAIGQCTGRTLAQVRSAAAKAGDLGLVAEQARSTQRTMFAPPPLSVRRVFAALRDVARMTGQASVNKKINKIQTLYVACKPLEARYLIRSLEGKLRIGLAEQSVLQALALAAATSPPGPGDLVLDASVGLDPDVFKRRVDECALIIKSTYCECPDFELLLDALLRHGVAALGAHCRLTPGMPLKPMLAQPARGVADVFQRFESERFTCEWKYDGERAQIHVPGESAPDLAGAAVFSRNQENNTSKYPDVLRRLPSLLKESVTSCVLDCEAVAYDTVNKQILPFQILSTRKRKDANEADIKVQVCVFVFDLLYLNGEPLVREPLSRRRELLRRHFNELEGQWQFATSKDCSSVEEVQQFLEDSVRGSCEGLMVKSLDGSLNKYYHQSLKKDYLEGAGDSIDAVVIGAYRGKGKRAGVYGGFLLACYEPHAEEYQSLCKIGTGFGDDDLTELTASLGKHVIDEPRSYYRFEASHAADVWLASACVWEVRCADLSLSPAHRAAIGLVDPDKGISLRFPRFIRVRDDKTPEQATSAQQIADMYLAQDQVKNSAAPRHDHDDFY